MLTSSVGIVLASFPYSDSSVICKIYTRDYGLNSFLIKGAKSPKNKHRLAALRPFQPVEVVHYRGRSELYLVKEMRIEYPLHAIAASSEKTCIALFISEVFYKSLSENATDLRLYDFIRASIEWLELTKNYLNFHLQFLLQLSRYLGFYPKVGQNFNEDLFGELELGNIQHDRKELFTLLSTLITHPEYNSAELPISNIHRRQLLHALVNFYTLHLDKNLEIKSLPVLESVFSN